jgi:hypothetical protein
VRNLNLVITLYFDTKFEDILDLLKKNLEKAVPDIEKEHAEKSHLRTNSLNQHNLSKTFFLTQQNSKRKFIPFIESRLQIYNRKKRMGKSIV